MPIGPENTQPTAGELALEIALRLPRDPDEAHAVLDMARELYAAFSNNTQPGAEVAALRPDQESCLSLRCQARHLSVDGRCELRTMVQLTAYETRWPPSGSGLLATRQAR